MIKDLIESMITSKTNGNKHIFSNHEIKLISNFEFLEIDRISFKFLFLINNIDNNLPFNILENSKKILALSFKFFEDKDIKQNKVHGVKIKNLVDLTRKIDDKKLTFEQDFVFEQMLTKNIILCAGTGFGKTFLTTNILFEKFNSTNKKQLLLVPTELLEEQLINRMKKTYDSTNVKIGHNFDIDDIVICTPEKIFSFLNVKFKLGTIIFDEAHLIFSDDDRGSFFKFIIKELISKNEEKTNFIFLTPFLDEIKTKELKKMFLKNNVIKINIKNQIKSNKFIINDFLDYKYNDENLYKINGTTLIYCSSVSQTKEKSKECLLNHDLKKMLKKRIEIIFNQDKILEKFWKEKMEELKSKYTNEYWIFDLLKYGISYLHSNMPDDLKIFIMDFIEKEVIKLTFASPIIINGIDLPFDNIILQKCEINQKLMNVNDFLNLIGRSGRITKRKGISNSGFSFIKDLGKKWYFNNKKEIKKRMNSSDPVFENAITIEEENNDFVNKSLSIFKETKNKIFLVDPRINPETTKKISSIITSENYNYIFEHIFINIGKKNLEKTNLSIISSIFSIYNLKEYDKSSPNFLKNKELQNKKSLFNDYLNYFLEHEKTNKNSVIKWTKFFLHNNCNLNQSISNYVRNNKYILKKQPKDFDFSNNLEKFIGDTKKYSKYLFNVFLIHFSKIITSNKYVSFDIAQQYGCISKEIFEIIKENNLLPLWKKIYDVKSNHKRKYIIKIIEDEKKYMNDLLKFLDKIIGYKDYKNIFNDQETKELDILKKAIREQCEKD